MPIFKVGGRSSGKAYSTRMAYIAELDMLATQIQMLTGLSLQQLLDLFAAGYILKPPAPPVNLADYAQEEHHG